MFSPKYDSWLALYMPNIIAYMLSIPNEFLLKFQFDRSDDFLGALSPKKKKKEKEKNSGYNVCVLFDFCRRK